MSTDEELMQEVQTFLVERSKKAIFLAREAIFKEQIKYTPLLEALTYFMQEVWTNAAPHPTLLSLTCEAVGGNPDAIIEISAAMVLLTGAADIHDDIIDQSITKDSKPTVYGKYGKDIAVIAGDVLWFKGIMMLNEACESFQKNKRYEILEIAKQSFFDIGSAEANEANQRRNLDLQPQKSLEIIRMKASVAGAAAKIGAIVGGGTEEEVKSLGDFGDNLGFLMTIRDEFVDVFEADELKNRFTNECLPLPILYAFQNIVLKRQILDILKQADIKESDSEKIAELVINSPQLHKLTGIMKSSMKIATESLTNMKKNKNIFNQLLKSALQDLPS